MESLVHYSSPAHAISLLGVLNEQRLSGQFCDVVLMAGDHRFPAHRSVLAASSEYFHTLFSGRDADTRDVIQLDFCEPEAFEIVLNYVYSSSLLVDRGSLVLVQELGYSLGIPFLTNIISTRPQVSYCVTRKKLCFPELEDDSFTKRSVIVHQGGAGGTHRGSAVLQEKASRHEENRPESGLDYGPAAEVRMNLSKNTFQTQDDSRSIIPSLTSILKGRAEYRAPSGRPQLTTSVSFSETIQHLNSDSGDDPAEEVKPEQTYDPQLVSGTQQRRHNQTVDRSGPLIKSLLRRSLSMDSPVPVFSPVLELKDSQSRTQSTLKQETNAAESAKSGNKRHLPPLVLRSEQHHTISMEDKDTQVQNRVTVKTEASSPLADPSEIIRVTVEDNLPVNFSDFQSNFEENPRRFFSTSVKRRLQVDGNSNAFKRSKVARDHQSMDEDGVDDESPRNSDDQEPGELKPTKMFKCWSCMKVFRSNAGLYRHVNMYHNPEKPYACDICHKRFHTNFKVWTHCQTQHGVVQNPPASSSSYSVLDEKFQRKLIDIVREREIKKALIMKLRRNKQSHQAQPFAKKSRRSRSYGCPYCGKMFFFQSHFKLHMKGHTAERASMDAQHEEGLCERQQQQAGLVKENQELFPCRLCSVKLCSVSELEDHERACRYATVCPYCGLRFSNTLVKKDHEAHCKYKKLTCLECMRTFKSSFSIWRHQVEVHNQNMMTLREQLTFGYHDPNQETQELPEAAPPPEEGIKDEAAYGDSEDSSSYLPEDLSSNHSQGKLVVKEEPQEEPVMDRSPSAPEETEVRPCEKCGKLFASHKALERHQELLCHIKPFICHICHKAFRTNFRLWSHYQSHMSSSGEPVSGQTDRPSSSPPPSPTFTQEPPSSRASPPKPSHAEVTASEEEEPRGLSSPLQKPERAEQEKPGSEFCGSHSENPAPSQEPDTLFYHAPTLSALTFKRQYMCKLCHRTFKTAFSLWSHEQSHV